MTKNKKPIKKSRTSKKYCPVCKLHKRGKNHETGQHHKKALRSTK